MPTGVQNFESPVETNEAQFLRKPERCALSQSRSTSRRQSQCKTQCRPPTFDKFERRGNGVQSQAKAPHTPIKALACHESRGVYRHSRPPMSETMGGEYWHVCAEVMPGAPRWIYNPNSHQKIMGTQQSAQGLSLTTVVVLKPAAVVSFVTFLRWFYRRTQRPQIRTAERRGDASASSRRSSASSISYGARAI